MKKMVRSFLRTFGLEIRRLSSEPSVRDDVLDFIDMGRVPWSRGYEAARVRLIGEILASADSLEGFRQGRLPKGYAVGVDERSIEYPWLFSQLQAVPGNLLDAGSVLNHGGIVDQPVLQRKNLHILTLTPEPNCFWHLGISYLYADLRDIPIRSDYYDEIACISTLEHIGCDNSRYKNDPIYREYRPDDYVLAMRELRRVLKPGGRLFLTVPFGKYNFFGSFQQFDRNALARAVEAFGTASDQVEDFYRYSAAGWQAATVEECADCEYVSWVAKVWQGNPWPEPIPVEGDRAAAARAVACLRLTKG